MKVQQEVLAMTQTPPCSSSKLPKVILLSKTTLASKPRDDCTTMAFAVDSAIVARVKEHCFPVH